MNINRTQSESYPINYSRTENRLDKSVSMENNTVRKFNSKESFLACHFTEDIYGILSFDPSPLMISIQFDRMLIKNLQSDIDLKTSRHGINAHIDCYSKPKYCVMQSFSINGVINLY